MYTVDYFNKIGQPYLSALYATMFVSAYYGLLRVGEITTGTHPVKVTDIHIGNNKNKILFVLRTSKMHWKDAKPQLIKFLAVPKDVCRNKTKAATTRNSLPSVCPFQVLRNYFACRKKYRHPQEPFFIFNDHSPVKPQHMRKTLKLMLHKLNFDSSLYDTHSFRSGRAVDLLKIHHLLVETIKKIGRWKSNSIFLYLSY